MVALPYVKKRIKQNLKGISFDEDSDSDSEWRRRERRGSRDGQEAARKVLPARSTRRLVDLISSESSSEED